MIVGKEGFEKQMEKVKADNSARHSICTYINIGTRLAVSAMLDASGFHLPSVDIFDWLRDHSMRSSHFIEWIRKTVFRLREDSGRFCSNFN